MKITLCVDALSPNLSGIGRYTWELAKGLGKRDDLALQFFGRNRLIPEVSPLFTGAPLQRRRRGLRRLGAWWDSRKLEGSLVHGPNYFLPRFAKRGVITVHDLSVFRHPETHPIERIRSFEAEFDNSLRRADHVITDTETVRQELIEDFRLAPEMVTAIHLGVGSHFRPMEGEELRKALHPLGLKPKAYALCVSTLEPRKKISELLAAWQRLPSNLRAEYPLVLAGGTGWLNTELQQQVKLGVTEGWLRHLGFVDEAQLPALYAGAALFVYPSIYEGFGLPPLEAMASGTPVIVSSRSCLPEVCGDAPRYIDPDDPDQLLSSISDSLLDEAWRLEASRRGMARAGNFSWERCVEETVGVYRKVAHRD